MPAAADPILAVIPVKGFRDAKDRLAAALDPGRRAALAEALAGRVADAWAGAGHPVLVVAGDGEVEEWGRARDLEVLPEPPAGGLNGSAGAGADEATARGMPWCIVHADLPLFTTADAAVVAEAAGPDRFVLAPSRDGGTNLLAGTGSFQFDYGPGSFARHLQAARRRPRIVIVRTGTAVEIDTPRDLAAVAALDGGRWLGSTLGWRP